ncbi:MAG: Cys-tRNA(Pro) deacylase [Desulfovibrio sp.]|nr:Cys-tRNA(Pro) deacylase [Desulfovibrio sp.]
MSKKIAKTNAARLLDKLRIPYNMHQVAVSEDDLSATTLAKALNEDPRQVFKTLVVRGDPHGVCMALLPADCALDLKALARLSGNKNVAMVPLKEVFGLTGYIRGGCSPLAAKKPYPIFLDIHAMDFPTIFISAGLRGVQLELAPKDLILACNPTLGSFTHTPETICVSNSSLL